MSKKEKLAMIILQSVGIASLQLDADEAQRKDVISAQTELELEEDQQLRSISRWDSDNKGHGFAV